MWCCVFRCILTLNTHYIRVYTYLLLCIQLPLHIPLCAYNTPITSFCLLHVVLCYSLYRLNSKLFQSLNSSKCNPSDVAFRCRSKSCNGDRDGVFRCRLKVVSGDCKHTCTVSFQSADEGEADQRAKRAGGEPRGQRLCLLAHRVQRQRLGVCG